jgi:bifunctional enzyme CysN/CysC
MTKSIIRLLTCGSVDDGKSTLIGRLLVQTDSVPHDTIDATRKIRRSGSTIPAGEIDFSLLTDGLEAEREQGITIDVAYRSMNLLNGKRLIISDAPGHEQYTRNMAVAASRADIALVLVDATRGVRTQTLRHLTICALMGVSHVIIAVNKLDAKDYSQAVFHSISLEISDALDRLEIKKATIIPMSALAGDNVVDKSKAMDWYIGPTLIQAIQDWVPDSTADRGARLQIQSISRAENFRGVSGTVHDGEFAVGDSIKTFPGGVSAKISRIVTFNGDVEKAVNGSATTLLLDPEIDATRGDLIVKSSEALISSDRYVANIVWLDENPLIHSRSYILISGTTTTPAIVTKIRHKIEVNSGEHNSATTLSMNEIGSIEIATDIALALLPYKESRDFGNFILVDRASNRTVGAGMIDHVLRRGSNITHHDYEIGKTERAQMKHQRPGVLWLTGLSGSGKSTIANELEKKLFNLGIHSYVLDGDNLRLGINKDLGFTPEERAENVRRTSEIAKLMVDAGLYVIVALVSPFKSDRDQARLLFEESEFFEAWVDTPIEICQARDPKGLYKKAAAGEIPNLTGLGQEYEVPVNPNIVLDGKLAVAENVNALLKLIL